MNHIVDNADREVFVAPGVRVTDAMVDFALGKANTESLAVWLTDDIPRDDFRRGAEQVDDGTWLADNGCGLYRGYSDSPVQPPADTSPRTTTVGVECADGERRSLTPLFGHMTKRSQNQREADSCFEATFKTSKRRTDTFPVHVGVGQAIVSRYINGPLGTETTSYWYWYRSSSKTPGSWAQSNRPREEYEAVKDADVALVSDDISVWAPRAIDEIDDQQRIYGHDAP